MMKLLLLAVMSRAAWIISTLQPTNYTVSAVSDLSFFLLASDPFLATDCVTI
jgi:hypothetical protein